MRCDAGRYVKENLSPAELGLQKINDSTILQDSRNIRDFGDVGEVIIPRVDHFDVLLGVEVVNTLTPSVALRYFTPEQYMSFLKGLAANSSITTDIISVKLSALVRAERPLTGEAGSSQFEIFGVKRALSSNTSNAFIRRVYESNIMLRNSRAIKESAI